MGRGRRQRGGTAARMGHGGWTLEASLRKPEKQDGEEGIKRQRGAETKAVGTTRRGMKVLGRYKHFDILDENEAI